MDNNKLIEVLYAASVACSQALVAYTQIRAQQSAVKKLDDSQSEEFFRGAGSPAPDGYRPIGFTRE